MAPDITEHGRYLLSVAPTTPPDEAGFRGSVRRADGRFIAFKSGAIAREFSTMIFSTEAAALADASTIADAAEVS